MDIRAEDFRKHFDLLSDEALLAVNRGELVPVAQQCLDDEIAKRGLAAASAEESATAEEPVADEPGAGGPGPEKPDLVVAASFDDPAEAENARLQLEGAKISCSLADDPGGGEGAGKALLVESADLFHALDALGLNISDEELAAQAEAAGFADAED